MRDKIEKLLIEKGVSTEHIDQMKIETSINIHEYRKHYEEMGIKKIELVETRKIKGIGSRIADSPERNLARIGGGRVITPAYIVDYDSLSWFDYISIRDEGLNLSRGRIMDIYEKFREKPLEENYTYYKENGVDPGSGSLTRLAYFVDEDIYAVSGDGTHRTLWAKVSNAPHLKAEVFYYKKKLNERTKKDR